MSVADFLRQFEQPDPRYSPAPIWWWSGERLAIDRMRWQLDQLARMGIHNVVVLNLAPSGPLFGSDADDPPFLSEEWWTIFTRVCDHAKSIGTFVWFYDQIGFSGANYQAELVAANPEFMAERLRVIRVEGVGTLRAECPGDAKPHAAYVVNLSKPEDAWYVPTEGRVASVDVNEPSKLRLVYTLRQGYDYFTRDACEKLLDTVHRQFEQRVPQHLGTTIPGSFQDELPDLPTWNRTFAQSFEDAFGYRITDVIHHLFEEGGDDARRTRMHYQQHRARLAEEALFKPFFAWHEKHGLQCGFDQQSPAREARIQGSVAKYADYTRTHRWYAIPGCDLHGNGKIHSSIAFMYDRPRVWIEGFHSTGWGGTIADTFDWLLPYLRSGCTLYNPHAVYYSTRMGWWEWAPPSTCWRQPYAMHYRGFADMVARLMKLFSSGVQQADVAVLFPTSTVQSSMTPTVDAFPPADVANEALHGLIGSMRWHQEDVGLLDKHAIEFHLLDEESIRNATMRDGTMRIRDVPIRTLFLPGVSMLERGTERAIRAFAEAGGRVVAIGSSEARTDDGNLIDFATLPNASVVKDVASVEPLLKDVPRAVRAPVATLHRRLDDGTHVLLVPAHTGMTTTVVWKDWFATLERATHDTSRCLKSVEIRLPDGARDVHRFDPIDASVERILMIGSTVSIDFRGASFTVLVWSDTDAEQTSQPDFVRAKRVLMTLSDEWTVEYVPTLPTEFADIFDPSRPELRLPHTAEFAWTSGASTETVRATFGIRAWAHVPRESKPRPLVYSPQFGIHRDRRHWYTLGPKGHVSEEFLDLGEMQVGQSVIVQTGVVSDADRDAVLAIGSSARKSAKVNERPATDHNDAAHLWMTPVRLARGDNPIEMTFTALCAGAQHAFWCLLDPSRADAFRRPERIVPADEPVAGSRLTFVGHFRADEPIAHGKVQVAVAAVAAVYVDDEPLGRLGGFDPYRIQMRAQPFNLPNLGAGEHELRIDLSDPGGRAPLTVDLRASSASGSVMTFTSGRNWRARRDDAPEMPVRLHGSQDGDGPAWHLYRRAHPLPNAAWIEGKQPSDVLDLPLVPPVPEPVAQRFEWTIPPGAVAMSLRLVDAQDARLRVDGHEVPLASEGDVSLPTDDAAPARLASLDVRSRQLGGAVLAAPVTYSFGVGTLRAGSWVGQGLRSYSGAVRMRRKLHLDYAQLGMRLDLGNVRGTVEARLNGRSLGQRFIAPYRFDLGDAICVGENELELVVTNTLGNFLSTWSPTRGWSPDQFECGVFGPVTLRG